MWNPHVIVAGHHVAIIPLALLGLFIGYVAGMFGVGGGFLLTPILSVVFRIPIQIAVGSTCQKVGTSVASFLKYRYYRRGEPRFDWIMMAGSVIGVDAGTRLLKYLSTMHRIPIGHQPSLGLVIIEAVYAVMLTITIWLSVREALRAKRARTQRRSHHPRPALAHPHPALYRSSQRPANAGFRSRSRIHGLHPRH